MRAGFFIDGFNMYGAIEDKIKFEKEKGYPLSHDLKWLSYQTLCNWIARTPDKCDLLKDAPPLPRRQQVEFIKFYSALPTHLRNTSRASKVTRHEAFIGACECQGVEVVLGKFKVNPRWCPNCETTYLKPEEKETDVHICVDVLAAALTGTIDVAYILSGDSDIAPAIKLAKELTDIRIVTVVFQPRRHSFEILDLACASRFVRVADLKQNLLPKVLVGPDGGTVTRPSKYAPLI